MIFLRRFKTNSLKRTAEFAHYIMLISTRARRMWPVTVN